MPAPTVALVHKGPDGYNLSIETRGSVRYGTSFDGVPLLLGFLSTKEDLCRIVSFNVFFVFIRLNFCYESNTF